MLKYNKSIKRVDNKQLTIKSEQIKFIAEHLERERKSRRARTTFKVGFSFEVNTAHCFSIVLISAQNALRIVQTSK